MMICSICQHQDNASYTAKLQIDERVLPLIVGLHITTKYLTFPVCLRCKIAVHINEGLNQAAIIIAVVFLFLGLVAMLSTGIRESLIFLVIGFVFLAGRWWGRKRVQGYFGKLGASSATLF
jgi:hydrogenase-4 membrane subunit HyfE